jgi:hypothetical protein
MDESELQYFKYDHLPAKLQEVSKPFAELAESVSKLPGESERKHALRKLLEAKDCAVRAALSQENTYRIIGK